VPGSEDEYADRVTNIDEKISIFKTYDVSNYYDTSPTGPVLNPYFYLPSNVHRIGTIMYKGEQEIQRTDRNEYLHLNMSKLTRPTTNYPLYIQEGQVSPIDPIPPNPVLCDDCIRVYVYPNTIKEDVSISYVRKPNNVVWAYELGALDQYLYSTNIGVGVVPTTGSVNFEIDDTEQTETILRILAYSGVVIRDPQIVQTAIQQVQATEANQKT